MKLTDAFAFLEQSTISFALNAGFMFEKGVNYTFENPPLDDALFNTLFLSNSLDKKVIDHARNHFKKPFFCEFLGKEPLDTTTPFLTELKLTWVANMLIQYYEDITSLNWQPKTAVQIKKVNNLAQLEAFDYITSQAFEHPLGMAVKYFQACIDKPTHNDQLFLTYLNDKPVGTGRLTSHSSFPFAYLSWDGVLPQYRNQGLATEMVLKRIEEAKKLGYKSVFVNNMPSSLNLYRRIGFQPLGTLQLFFCDYIK